MSFPQYVRNRVRFVVSGFTVAMFVANISAATDNPIPPVPSTFQIRAMVSASRDPIASVRDLTREVTLQKFHVHPPPGIKIQKEDGKWDEWNIPAGSYNLWAEAMEQASDGELDFILKQLATPAAVAWAPRVQPFLKSKQPGTVLTAAKTLEAMGVNEHLTSLAKHPDSVVRRYVLEKLIAKNAPEEVDVLLSALLDSATSDIPEAADRAFFAARASRLALLLSNKDAGVRIHCLHILAVVGAKDEAPKMVYLLDPAEPPAVVQKAAEALVHLNYREFYDRIPALLSGPDPENICTALRLLGLDESSDTAYLRLNDFAPPGKVPAAAKAYTELVVKVLENESPRIVKEAIKAMRRLDARPFSSSIAALLTPERSPEVTEEALMALGDFEAMEYADTVASYLSEEFPSSGTSCVSVHTLGKMRAARYAGRIAEILRKTKEGDAFRQHAVEALENMQAEDEVPAIRELLSQTSDTFLKATCVKALVGLHQLSSEQGLISIGELLRTYSYHNDRYHFSRRGLLTIAHRMDPVGSLEFFLRYAVDNDNQEDVFEVLSNANSGFSAREYAFLLDSPDETVRNAALGILRGSRENGFAPQVKALLHTDQNPEIRRQALVYLDEADRPTAIDEALRLVASSEPESLRSQAMDVLKGVDRPDVVSVLTKCLDHDESGNLRAEFAATLLTMPSVSDPFLTDCLAAGQPGSVRRAAFEALERKTGPAAVPVLVSLLGDEENWIREKAAENIIRLTGNHDPGGLSPWLLHPGKDIRMNILKVLPAGAEWTAGYRNDVAASLKDEDIEVRHEAGRALVRIGLRDLLPAVLQTILTGRYGVDAELIEILRGYDEPPASKGLPFLVEAAQRDFNNRSEILYTAHLMFGGSPETGRLLDWLGNRSASERPNAPAGPGAASSLLSALREFMQEASAEGCGQALFEGASVAAEIAQTAVWNVSDAGDLLDLAREVEMHPALQSKASRIREVAQRQYERQPWQRVKRWGLTALTIQPVLWALLLLLYPYWSVAQWMVWLPFVRKVAGFGWVGPLITGVPFFRNRLWRPFRESLVPPSEVQTFDEWTFFDSVRMVPEGASAPVIPALSTLQNAGGVTVLRGSSGLGKTTLLQALASTMPAPVAFLRAAECREGILTALRKRLPARAQHDPVFLRTLVKKGSPALLVDAMHEAPPAIQNAMSAEVNALSGAHVLLTSQPAAWTSPKDAISWEVQPLRPEDLATFLLKQGSAAIETAGAASLPAKWKEFNTRVQTFLHDLEARPSDDPTTTAMRRQLGNPMDAVFISELLAAGETPDPLRLLAQRMNHLMEEYVASHKDPFPSLPFAEHLLTTRLTGAPLISMTGFEGIAEFLAKHRLLRKNSVADGWRFRHDKIMDWFLAPAFVNETDPVRRGLREDARFAGVPVQT